MSEDTKSIQEKMDKTINVLKQDLDTIRAGRANPGILNKVMVEYYGTPTPLSQVGNVSIPEARTILIQPWDKSLLKEIEKAIQKSDIGLNPNNDGQAIRLSIPQLTEDRRKELKREIEKKGEDAKIAIRAIRRDGVDNAKDQKKSGELTEDDLKDVEKKIQNITDKHTDEIDNIVELKSKEIMEV